MPLTATGPGDVHLDATDCAEEVWAGIHRSKPRVDLRCRGCGAPMHAKVSSAGSRFFAHDSLNPVCPSLGETPEHRELKHRIARTLRESGYQAEVEATPSTSDFGGWRADVLGLAPDGRRVAFEVQLAPMTFAEGNERTERYQRDGIQCVWVTIRQAHWIGSLPSCHLTEDDGELVVDRGLGRLAQHSTLDYWLPAGPFAFSKVANGLLRGRIRVAREATLMAADGGRFMFPLTSMLLVPASELDAQNQAAAERLRKIEEHARNLSAFYERQERVLQLAIDDAVLALERGDILLGVPPKPWDGALPIPPSLARGNDATGGGAAIWSRGPQGSPQLWAIVCPVAGKSSRGLGASWRNRRVRVYTETRRESERVAAALGWDADHVVTRGPSDEGPHAPAGTPRRAGSPAYQAAGRDTMPTAGAHRVRVVSGAA